VTNMADKSPKKKEVKKPKAERIVSDSASTVSKPVKKPKKTY